MHQAPLQTTLEIVSARITVLVPVVHASRSAQQREGLPPQLVEVIQDITQPDHPDNPWDDLRCRYRNSLIVDWLLYLGLRRGELLGIRIPDINFQQETVTVYRRADDPSDPRFHQPKAKTLGRVIPISRGLLDRTNDISSMFALKLLARGPTHFCSLRAMPADRCLCRQSISYFVCSEASVPPPPTRASLPCLSSHLERALFLGKNKLIGTR
jgi:integrase